jgi:Alanine-zipper, major outer membrane lipoprotein
MTLIAPDASSLAASLSRWEIFEYCACGLVAIACAGEYIADFTNWFTAGIEERKKRLAKVSTLLLIASLAFELVCLVETNSVSGRLIGSLSEKASAADSKSDSALVKANTAVTKADAAGVAAGEAQKKVDAVSERAEEIDSDLARTQYLISGRHVTNSDSLVRQLKRYKGQIVHFQSYNSEPDETLLCGELLSTANSAGMNTREECGRLLAVGKPSTGVVISGPDTSQTVALASIILHTSSLGAGGITSGIPASELTILVGAKPPFAIGQARGNRITPRKHKQNRAEVKQ